MTIGGFIFFKSKKERNHSSNILNKLYCQNKKVFEIKNFNDNSIYYYINLRSSKVFSKNELEEPINLKKYLIDNFKNNEIKPKEKIDITNFLFKEIEFIKTTGVHSPEGLILYENVKSLNRFKRIENHKLFNSMLKHFDS